MKVLLDGDVFLAAIYAGYEYHREARQWLDSHKADEWGIAAETFLATAHLLMNPALMGSGALPAADARQAIETELSGPFPGRMVLAVKPPDFTLLSRTSGHRQIMDLWLVQIARDSGARLATRDGGSLANWPDDTISVR